jgi:hypothetical protein
MLTIAVLCLVLAQQRILENLIDEPLDPKDMVELNGGKDPNLIAEWAVWQYTFDALEQGTGTQDLPTTIALVATRADAVLIFRAAGESQRNDAELTVLGNKTYDALLAIKHACDRDEATPPKRKDCFVQKGKTIGEEYREREIESRQRTLDIRDRLLEQLDVAGRLTTKSALLAWSEERRSRMVIYVHKTQLDHYYKPR